MEELSQSKIEQLNKMPIVESSVSKSDDGKWIVNKVTITSKPSLKNRIRQYQRKTINAFSRIPGD